MGSHGDAENAEVLRAQRVASGSLALRRLRRVIWVLVMVWFAPGGSAVAGWSRPRPAVSAAGGAWIPPEETTLVMNVDPGGERSDPRGTQPDPATRLRALRVSA